MKAFKRKRRKIKIGKAGRNFIIMICCLICAFVLTVIIGNKLGKKADIINSDTSVDTAIEQNSEDAIHAFNPSVVSVNARFFNIENMTTNQIPTQISLQISKNVTTVSINVLDGEGNPNYDSAVAKAFYGVEGCNAYLELGTLISQFNGRGISVCFCFCFTAYSIEDKNTRQAKAAYELALLEEVAEKGAGEVLISGFSVTDEDSLNQYVSMVNQLQINYPETFFGVSFDYTYYINNTIAPILYAFSAVADFSAVDVTQLDDEIMTFEQFIEQNRYYINRYNLRILLTYKDEATLSDYLAKMSEREMHNWQIALCE